MPSEKIYSSSHPGDTSGLHVRVAWGNGHESLQIASLFESHQGADSVIQMVNEWLTAAGLPEIPGRADLDKLVKERTDPGNLVHQFGIGFEGFHVPLDSRSRANELIRTVRRARDAAFGKDE